jgi:hypothetical protein
VCYTGYIRHYNRKKSFGILPLYFTVSHVAISGTVAVTTCTDTALRVQYCSTTDVVDGAIVRHINSVYAEQCEIGNVQVLTLQCPNGHRDLNRP